MATTRSALLWAMFTIFTLTLTGCPDEPTNPDSSCNSCPCNAALCPGDGGMDADMGDSGNSCIPVPELPNLANRCSNGVDDDCDGYADANDSDCGGSCMPVAENNDIVCFDNVDNDCDTKSDEFDSDCQAARCHPGTGPGPDDVDGAHGSSLDRCFDFSWRNDIRVGGSWNMAMILAEDKLWNCCPTSGNAPCVDRDLLFTWSEGQDYEPSVGWSGTGRRYGVERGLAGERLFVNRISNVYMRVMDDGTIEQGTLNGDARTPTETCN